MKGSLFVKMCLFNNAYDLCVQYWGCAFSVFSGILWVLLIKFIHVLLKLMKCFNHDIAKFDIAIRITFMHEFKIRFNSPWALTVPLKIYTNKIKSVGVLLKHSNQKIFCIVHFGSAPVDKINFGSLQKCNM